MKIIYHSIIIVSLLGLSFLSINHVYAPCPAGVISCGDLRPLPLDTRPFELFQEHFSSDRIPCKPGLYMAIKSDNQEPVCLKAGTISKLASRGFFYGISANQSQSYYTTILIPPGSEYESSNKTFSPDITTIKLAENETIRWVNQANITDTLVADTPFEQFGVQFGSPALHPGESYEFTFATVGTYHYHEKSHPWQKGTIHVLGNPSSVKLEKAILNKTDSMSFLKLYLSSPDAVKLGQPVDITISVNNTSVNPIQVDAQDAWSFENVSTGPCARIGYGISIFDGYYTSANLTGVSDLSIFNPGVMCPFIAEHAQEYEFQPSSDVVKEIKCDQTQNMQCNLDPYPMSHSYSFSGYWNHGEIVPFKSGVYTIIGADEWGHAEIRHFVVTNSTIVAGELGSIPCDTPYPQSDSGIAVMYMPANSVGKVCVRYYNLNNTPTGVGARIFEAKNLTQNAPDITISASNNTLQGSENTTIVYSIKTGNKTGFYGLSLNCGGIPLAVGYGDNSTITTNDFPWVDQVFHCGVITYESHIEGTGGIGVRHIPDSSSAP